MSYDPTTASCFYCERGIDLALMEHEIRDSQPVHAECAKALDEEYPTEAKIAARRGPQ